MEKQLTFEKQFYVQQLLEMKKLMLLNTLNP
jgi:hypothetical protein